MDVRQYVGYGSYLKGTQCSSSSVPRSSSANTTKVLVSSYYYLDGIRFSRKASKSYEIVCYTSHYPEVLLGLSFKT
jgi:hypothetical protein